LFWVEGDVFGLNWFSVISDVYIQRELIHQEGVSDLVEIKPVLVEMLVELDLAFAEFLDRQLAVLVTVRKDCAIRPAIPHLKAQIGKLEDLVIMREIL
jgi:hypothetical protein